MGRGLISGGGAEGRYNLTYKVKRADAEKKITALTARITALENIDIPKYETGLTTAINDFNTKLAELNAAIAAKETADVLRQLAAEASTLRFAMDEAQNLLDSAKIRLISFIKEKDTLENWLADFADEELVVWCADLNEDLTDHVGTIEIPGERTEDIIIKPGGDAGDQAVYNPATDGQIAPSIGMTPSGIFYNLAILPGWQKWMPTYRLGVITAINYNNDTCDVTLRPALSKQKDLSGINFDVNQETLLTDVQIEYMDCHSKVFKINDHVVVQFRHSGPGELDYTPKVIGFKDHPRSCGFLVFLIISSTEYAVWDVREYTNGRKIIPYDLPLENYTSEFSLPYLTFANVVQSKADYSFHQYSIRDVTSWAWGSTTQKPRYGSARNDGHGIKIIGLRNSYTPSGWTPETPEEFDSDTLWVSFNPTTAEGYRYTCSSRKNWLEVGGAIIKHLEIWHQKPGFPQVAIVTYKDKNTQLYINNTIAFVQGSPDIITDSNNGLGIFNVGDALLLRVTASVSNRLKTFVIDAVAAGQIDLDTNNQLVNEAAGASKTLEDRKIGSILTVAEVPYTFRYFAVLSKDKYVGFDPDFITHNNEDLSTVSEDIYTMCGKGGSEPPCDCGGMSTYSQDFTVGTEENGIEFKYMFGDVEVESLKRYVKTTWSYQIYSNSCNVCSNCDPPPRTCRPSNYFGVIKRVTLKDAEDYLVPKGIAYDNKDIDDTFIFIYQKNGFIGPLPGYSSYYETRNITPTPYFGTGWRKWVFHGGTKYMWILAYRINGGSLKKIDICQWENTTYETNEDSMVYNSCGGVYKAVLNDPETTSPGYSGQRVMNPTCKISDGKILYSYVIEDFVGDPNTPPAGGYLNDDASWAFNKRVLGIISMRTGLRTEHEVNDSLLGDLYKDTFDEEKAAAVGLHRS